MKRSLLRFLIISAVFLVTATSAFSQNKLISSRNYFGIEAGVNYSWSAGADKFVVSYQHPFTDVFASPTYLLMPLTGLGKGIGGLIGLTLDLSLIDQLALQAKLQYRPHSLSITEQDMENCTDGFGNVGTATFENHIATSQSYVGLDALLRIQIVPEGFYANVGIGYSNLLSSKQEGYRDIVSSTNNCEWVYLPSRTSTNGTTHAPIASTDTKNLFNSSLIHAKVGVGTFIPIGSNGWVLTPELQIAIPMNEHYVATEVEAYKALGITPPKLWYAALSVALKFPFGGESSPMMEEERGGTVTPEPTKNSNKFHLKGRVTNERNGDPVSNANITVIDLSNNEAVADSRTDYDGKYDVEVKNAGKYSVSADADGYLFGSAYFVVDPDGNVTVGKGDIKLSEANGGKVRLLVFFDFNKDELQRSSFPELDRAVRFMKANPNVEVEIAGYTDSKGTDDYNNDLSQRRSNSVKNYLTNKGIPASRLDSRGYGKANPVATNDTEDGRAENRRVEFIVKKR